MGPINEVPLLQDPEHASAVESLGVPRPRAYSLHTTTLGTPTTSKDVWGELLQDPEHASEVESVGVPRPRAYPSQKTTLRTPTTRKAVGGEIWKARPAHSDGMDMRKHARSRRAALRRGFVRHNGHVRRNGPQRQVARLPLCVPFLAKRCRMDRFHTSTRAARQRTPSGFLFRLKLNPDECDTGRICCSQLSSLELGPGQMPGNVMGERRSPVRG